MDFTPNVAQWCLSNRNLEPAKANEFHIFRCSVLPCGRTCGLCTKRCQDKIADLMCPFAQCALNGPMLVWLSWYVIVSDDQAGKRELFPSFNVMSISGAHYRQFRPEWAFARGRWCQAT